MPLPLSETVNFSQLFSKLKDPSWSSDAKSLDFSEATYEYLLRFCEVNRNCLIDRIDKAGDRHQTPILIQRISQLLLDKWIRDTDYRMLNLLYKFRTNRYLDHFPKDAVSRDLRAKLDKTLHQELNHD